MLGGSGMALSLPHRILQRSQLAFGRLGRGMTLGVRAMLLEADGIVLVQHTYLPGWYLPGGGVEPGETAAQAAAREAAEEAGAALATAPELFGLYHNPQADRRDHVALFVCRDWTLAPHRRKHNFEIAAVDTFRLDALPPGATRATRARIAEVLQGAPQAETW